MTRDDAKEKCEQYVEVEPRGAIDLRRFIDKIYDDFENKKCTNCKHCDQVKEGLIHCSYFEQYMPLEIGKCDLWEGKDEH